MDDIDANTAGLNTDEGIYRLIIPLQSCPCPAGMIGPGSLHGFFVSPTDYRCYASNAILSSQKGKTVSADKLKAEIKVTLERAKQQLAQNRIEKLAKEVFGDDNFVTASDLYYYATLDIHDLKKFILNVAKVRNEIDAEFFFTIKSLAGEYDE